MLVNIDIRGCYQFDANEKPSSPTMVFEETFGWSTHHILIPWPFSGRWSMFFLVFLFYSIRRNAFQWMTFASIFFFFWFSVRATAPCGRNALICGSGTTRRPSINQPKSSCKNQKCLEKWLCTTSDGYRSNCFYIFLIPVYNFHDFVYIDIIEVYAVYVNHSIFFYFIGWNIRRRKKTQTAKRMTIFRWIL